LDSQFDGAPPAHFIDCELKEMYGAGPEFLAEEDNYDD
jgi:hypothetical protein